MTNNVPLRAAGTVFTRGTAAQIVDHHGGAAPREFKAESRAQSTTASGDDSDLASEVHTGLPCRHDRAASCWAWKKVR
jgi:hypothetical protein